MSDEITLNGKTYVPSRRAAEESKYAQDYIGQLARAGLIEAERVGGLWYVTMDSLNAYKESSMAAAAAAPVPQPTSATRESDTLISFDGRDYISASRASKITGYNQDYIGQLARAGKILSRQVGNRWYVDREGLESHKSQKDAMLASVQAESTGVTAARTEIERESVSASRAATPEHRDDRLMHYFQEDSALIPTLNGFQTGNGQSGTITTMPQTYEPEASRDTLEEEVPSSVPIRIVRQEVHRPLYARASVPVSAFSSWDQYGPLVTRSVFAITVVVVLMYGFVSLKNGSIYSYVGKADSLQSVSAALTASAAPAIDFIGDAIENIVSPVITYTRR